MLIHYDSGLVEPELTSHVFRDHFGQESSWYAVDFKVKTLVYMRISTLDFNSYEQRSGEE